MTESMIIQKQPVREAGYQMMAVSLSLHKKLRMLAAETGVPMRQILDTMIRYGFENLEVKEDQFYLGGDE